ncbi:adenosylcobinamide-GDP ribazoletransferase [Sphingomonas morindae]|uniref:Adenosylcobinamide-GDP ribazoletransferase n=1 Tax=Sphingomonas morindae TaxID=1541170 RepID=A0ABY4XC70_9SPHN|nr:adenosylcobinamide-GDP ribazoletransferase [Sphingomonas morindae]USI74321.1 adenosylcobinamide-GDP ribazoletransferase [Sphingomonas morindae]
MPAAPIERAPGWAPPLLALQLLTRVPLPWLGRLDGPAARRAMARALAWLPLAGAAVGLATGLAYLAASHIWSPLPALLLALAFEAWLTGALHEDGLADFCDAFGGGRTPEQIARILKDSRIGSYGALGLGLAVALRIAATLALPAPLRLAGIVAAASLGRWMAVLLLGLAPPPPDATGLAASLGAPSRRVRIGATLAALPALLACARLAPAPVLAGVAAALIGLVALARLVRRRLGAANGDCLGFAACAGQLALLMALAAR